MSYTPNFLINREQLDKAVKEDVLFDVYKDKQETAERLLDEIMYFEDVVEIKGTEYYFSSTELSYQHSEISEYLEVNNVEFYKFGG